jgi:hypothetical protein
VILLALIITYSGFQNNEVGLNAGTTDQIHGNIIDPIENIINIRKTEKSNKTILNPFKKNLLKRQSVDKITISISGVIEFQNPSDNIAIINDTTLGINDYISGLLITDIFSDYIILKCDAQNIRIPIQDNVVSICIENTNKY